MGAQLLRERHPPAQGRTLRGASIQAFDVGANAQKDGVGVDGQTLESRQNGSVAGATTNVAPERVLDPFHRQVSRFVEGVHVHHHARRAEAALRAVELRQSLLDRMIAF